MEPIAIGLFWEKVLAETKKKIQRPLWENLIYSGLFPISLTNTCLTLGVMQDYIKNIIEKNAKLYGTLKNTAEQICGYPLTLTIVTMDDEIEETSEIVSSETFISEPSIDTKLTSSIQMPPESLSTVFTPMAATEEDPFIPKEEPLYDEPIILPDKSTEKLSIEKNIPVMEELDFTYEPTDEAFASMPTRTSYENALHESHLNKSLTFDTFINGNSSRMAYGAAQNVADYPATNYNPLFIYGQSGLGKTHLMHAIGNKILQNFPHYKIKCVTSEKFLSLYVDSIRQKCQSSFRDAFRNVDVLMVDDIQFLGTGSKASTQEEFFHTFNELFDDNNKKQIILTSDVLPKDMPLMENRLRSRFQSGFLVTIDPPDLETRIAILRYKVEKEMSKNPHLKISNDVITYVASSFDKNIRILQGALNRLIGAASLEGLNRPITMDFAQKILSDLITEDQTPFLSVTYIQEFIASYFKIKKEDLLSQKRNKQFAYPRQIAMYLCRELVNESYPQISLSFGKKDHTTALHAFEKISKEIEKSPETKRIIEEIINKIHNRG